MKIELTDTLAQNVYIWITQRLNMTTGYADPHQLRGSLGISLCVPT
jgi:hypothetical protein